MKNWVKNWELWREGLLAVIVVLIIYKIIDNLYPLWQEVQNFLKVVRPFTGGFIIAYFLNVPCNKLEAKLGGSKGARGLSVLIIYLLVLSLIGVTISYVLPIIVFNIMEFMNYIPAYLTYMIENVGENSLLVYIVDAVTNALTNLVSLQEIFDQVGYGLNSIGEYAIMISTGVIHLFLSIVISIYFLLYKNKILIVMDQLARFFVKERHLQTIKSYLQQSNEVFYKFITCQFLDACIIAVISVVVLSLFKVDYAFTLGVLLGVCNMIPYFGSIFASTITVIITMFTGGSTLALIIGIFLLILQQIDGSIIGPRLMGDALDLNPILIILAITMGGAYFGVIGMFLSVPLAAIVKIIMNQLLGYKILNYRNHQ